jgi:hypothetical protein
MRMQWKKAGMVLALAAVTAIGAAVKNAGGQAGGASQSVVTPQSPNVAAGEAEAKKLLLLMDTDKSGTVSKQEFMAFMSAEFDRLDVNKDGMLDVKELEQSQLVTAHRGGGHR